VLEIVQPKAEPTGARAGQSSDCHWPAAQRGVLGLRNGAPGPKRSARPPNLARDSGRWPDWLLGRSEVGEGTSRLRNWDLFRRDMARRARWWQSSTLHDVFPRRRKQRRPTVAHVGCQSDARLSCHRLSVRHGLTPRALLISIPNRQRMGESYEGILCDGSPYPGRVAETTVADKALRRLSCPIWRVKGEGP
jgi:hypothetical protein